MTYLNFPKRKKKAMPWLLLLTIQAVFLVVIALFGDGGVLHALTMRVYQKQAEEKAIAQQIENQKLREMIHDLQTDPAKAKIVLAEQRFLAEEEAVVYHFKTMEEISSIQMISEVEGLNWLQKTKLRWELTVKDWF